MGIKGLNDNKVTVEAGISNGLIGKARKRGSLSQESISKILYAYPDLNPEWLLTGKGSMLKQESNTVKGRAETHGINEGEATLKPTSDALSDIQKLALYVLKNIDEMEKEPIFMNYVNKRVYEIALDIIADKLSE